MKSNSVLTFTSVLLLAAFGCLADQTNALQPSGQKPTQIKTNFVKGAELNSIEINQVLMLARQSGIEDAAEVETFNYLPGGGRGISVKSKDHVDGRNISYDTVLLSKNGWDGLEPDKTTKRLGNFCVREPGKYTTHLRTYELKKITIRIVIGEGIDTAFADKVIPLIASKKVRFANDNDWVRRNFNELGEFAPATLYISDSNKGEYEMRFSGSDNHILMFKLDKDEVVITGIATYFI